MMAQALYLNPLNSKQKNEDPVKKFLVLILASLTAVSALAGTIEYSDDNQVDGFLSSSMLRALISDSGKLQAKEYEHDKVVGQVPVELVIATAIESNAQFSNSCAFIQRSRRIQCVLSIKTAKKSSELIYNGYADDHEKGTIIQNVIFKTL